MKTDKCIRIALLELGEVPMDVIKERIDNLLGGVSLQHLRLVMRGLRDAGQVIMKGKASKYSSPTYRLSGEGKKQAKKDLKQLNNAK